MICVAALIVFAVLAIFSAKYRPLAREAFDCVFRKLTLRPCQSGLDRRVRVAAMMPFMKRAPKFAKGVYTYFPIISTIFVLLTAVSLVYIAYGGYNYALYGNCNGPGSTGFCVFDPSGAESSVLEECTEQQRTPEALLIPTADNLTGFKEFNSQGDTTVVFFGCYSCPYTRQAIPALFDVIETRPDVRFILIDFPLPSHAGSELAANAANCVYDEEPLAYRAYATLLYQANLSQGLPVVSEEIEQGDGSLAFDPEAVALCAQEEHPRVAAGKALGKALGIYGTPTYFMNGKAYVGPLNARALKKLIDG